MDSKGTIGVEKSPVMIRCNGCVQVPCVLSCDSNAVAHVCGDLLIELDKCTVCGRYKGLRFKGFWFKGFRSKGLQSPGVSIPGCVVSCKHSKEKVVVEVLDPQMKQTRAATALSLLKL